jgi:hypothetical protein
MSDRLSEANEAKGCVARGGGYGPFASPLAVNGGLAVLDTQALGAATFINASGDGVTFAGDAAKLYRLVSGTFDDASDAGGYTLGTEDHWVFEQFGQFVVAVAGGEDPQVFQMEVSTDFAALGGNPPQFTSIWRFGDFLMGGLNYTVTWSAFNNITDWTPDPGTQSDSQELDQAGGQIMGGTIGEYGAIFQENHIRRVTYVGPPAIFSFEQDAIEKRRGALSRAAFVRVGRLIYYASEQGFYVFDGQQSIPIGENKVDDYFKTRLNYARRDLVSAAYDSAQKAIVFGFPVGDATTITEQLIFSLTDHRWTHDDIPLEFLFETTGATFTVDNISGFFGHDNLDLVTGISIDSAAFRGGQKRLAGFTTAHMLANFDGQPRPAIIDTIEAELIPGRRSLVTELWPLLDIDDRAAVAARVAYRVLPGDPIQLAPAATMNVYGFCDALTDSRFLRARVEIAANAGWTRADGVGFLGRPTSAR